MTDDVGSGLAGPVLVALRDKAELLAEELAAIQIRRQRGTIDDEERQAQWEAASAEFYTGDNRQDELLNGFLIFALSDLAAWSWLEGRRAA